MTDNTRRETIGHFRFRKDAELNAQRARKNGRTNVMVIGEQGAWKLRADRDVSHEKTGWRPGP